MPFVDTLTLPALETGPEIDLSSLPSVDRVLLCQMGEVSSLFKPCYAPATMRVLIAHSGGNDTTCAPLPYLLCDHDLQLIDNVLRQRAAVRCDCCGTSIRRRSQLVTWRARL